jgi:hypothetical protein
MRWPSLSQAWAETGSIAKTAEATAKTVKGKVGRGMRRVNMKASISVNQCRTTQGGIDCLRCGQPRNCLSPDAKAVTFSLRRIKMNIGIM